MNFVLDLAPLPLLNIVSRIALGFGPMLHEYDADLSMSASLTHGSEDGLGAKVEINVDTNLGRNSPERTVLMQITFWHFYR